MTEKHNKTEYCVGYRCKENQGWEVGFHACICPDEKIFQQMVDQVRSSELQISQELRNETLCCNSTLFAQTKEVRGITELTCPMDKTAGKLEQKNLKCSKNSWAVHEIKDYESTKEVYQRRCIGPSWPSLPNKFQQGLVMNVFECKGGPCGGREPIGVCIR